MNMDCLRCPVRLQDGTRLQTVKWPVGWHMTDEAGVRPAQPSARMHTEQRIEPPRRSEREQHFKRGSVWLIPLDPPGHRTRNVAEAADELPGAGEDVTEGVL